MHDQNTVDYFDEHTPEYYVERYNYAVDFINTHCPPDASLIDLGCGNGNTLEFIRDGTDVSLLVGMDVSTKYLAQVRERLDCETLAGSVLDSALIEPLRGRYDFAIAGALLHHLIGRTRGESLRLAEQAVRNAFALLKEGGHLFIVEPTFGPPFLMTLAFYVKKLVTRLCTHRLEIFSDWANIGPPVVSYYTNEQLEAMATAPPGAEIVGREIKDPRRLGGVLRRTRTTLIIRKTPTRSPV